MSLEAIDIERRLRANRDAFLLKEHATYFSPSVELANYKSLKVPPAFSNSLDFWKEHVHVVDCAESTVHQRELRPVRERLLFEQ